MVERPDHASLFVSSTIAYYGLPATLGAAERFSEEEIEKQLKYLVGECGGEGCSRTVGPGSLKDLIASELGIGDLLSGMDERELVVVQIGETLHVGHVERHLIFRDPFIGDMEVIFLMPPEASSPGPAIVGLHGHEDNGDDFRNEYMGSVLADAGYFVVMPSFRAMRLEGEEREDQKVSLYLLRYGLSLMGVRVYETLLLLKYLRYLPTVDNHRIGIMAHSGGNAVAALVVRLTDFVSVRVADYFSPYLSLYKDHLHCETVPGLYHAHESINDDSSAGIPVLRVPYGYDPMQKTIRAFLDEHLR